MTFIGGLLRSLRIDGQEPSRKWQRLNLARAAFERIGYSGGSPLNDEPRFHANFPLVQGVASCA